MENQVLIALKNNKLLKNILFDELTLDGIKGELITVHEGEILFRESDKSNNIYLVVSGEINLLKKRPGNKALSFIFTDHDFFGCDEFIEKIPRNSTAVALRDSYIISFTRNEVDLLIEQNDEILKNIYKSVSDREPDSVETSIPDEQIEKVDFRSSAKEKEQVDEKPEEGEIEECVNTEDEIKESEPHESLESDRSKDDELKELESTETFETKEDEPEVEETYLDKEDFGEQKIETGGEQAADITEEEETFSLDSLESDTLESLEETKPEFTSEDDPAQFDEDILKSLPDDDIPKPEGEISEPENEEISSQDSLSFESDDELEMPQADDGSDSEFNFNERFGNAELSDESDETKIESKEDESEKEEERVEPGDEFVDEKISPEKILEDELDLSKYEDPVPDFESEADEETDKPDAQEEGEPAIEENEIEKEPESLEEKLEEELSNFETLSVDEFKIEDEAEIKKDTATDESTQNVKPEESLSESSDEQSETKDEPIEKVIDEPEDQPKREKIDMPVINSMDDVPAAELIEKVNKAAELVNSNLKIDEVLQNIVNVACDLTHADRGTLYMVDKDKKELWSKIALGNEFKEIKLKLGEGIAGYVAESGEILNIDDVQSDSRFTSRFDKSSGYVTKSMLCYPIRNKNDEVVGVLQLLNSKNNNFSKVDEEFLKALSTHAALALQNAELVEKLLSTERVSSLGKMANFLIQDIKKPIMVSKRYAEHLKAKELPEEVTKVVDMMLDQLNHIADLVQATSSYSEGEIVMRSIVKNINEALDDCIVRDESFVQTRNCNFVKEFDKNVNVKLSEKQFYQAFHHIIKNACDAMPDGGDVVISTKRTDSSVEITFKDSGLGIPESLHEKIFEPFMSHGKKEGTGLGLSITKKIIEEHGGSIKVESETGEGAKFIVSLPIVKSAV